MGYLWRNLLRKSYHRYPIPSFIFTIGLVDMMIGGANLQWSLLMVGASMATAALVLYGWQTQAGSSRARLSHGRYERDVAPPPPPLRYLPERASRPAIPRLQSRPPGNFQGRSR